MQKQSTPWYVWAILLGGIWLAAGRPGIDSISLPSLTTKADRATYVYEKDQGDVPNAVEAALTALNADKTRGILASAVDDDIVNAAGETPKQYRIAITTAKTAGLPALVVQAGDKVLSVKKTEAEVLEALK